ncbi:MAG: hypothetical protein RMJ07_06640 [Nitrososphaerota archaeon]|nr:hypothetical protein [Candidatus Bathyarchaeota archaeon]MDW8049332.1 hypothetical protein [Nitrososphaerota archaeon]
MSKLLKRGMVSGTNIARIIALAIIAIIVVIYFATRPPPAQPDIKITGSFSFDLETDNVNPTVKTIRIESVNGFSGSVTISRGSLVWPSGYTGPTRVDITISPQTVNVPSGGYASVTISFLAPSTVWDTYLQASGWPTFTFDLIVTGGGITRTQTFSIRVANMVT